MNTLAWELRYDDCARTLALSQTARDLATQGKFKAQPYQKGLAESLRNLGHCYERLADYDLALSLLVEALALFQAMANQHQAGIVLYLLGGVYWSLGNYFNALDCEFKALKLCQESGDKLRLGSSLNIIGLVYQSVGDLATALDYFLQSLEICEEIGYKLGQGDALSNCCEIYFELAEYDQALIYGLKSLQIHEEINYRSDIGLVLVIIGRVYLALQQQAQAFDYLDKALVVSRETGNRYSELIALLYLGDVHDQAGEDDKALSFLQQAVAMAQALGVRQELYESYQLLARVYKQRGEFEKALVAYEQFYSLKQKVFEEITWHKLKIFEVVFEMQATKREVEAQRLKNIELEQAIIERKQAEESLAKRTTELEETLNVLNGVIERLPVMLFMKDATTLRFTHFNKAAEDLVGLKRVEVIGHNDYDFFPKEQADFFVARDHEVLAKGELLEITEEPIQTMHHGSRLLYTRKAPILAVDGKPKYLLGISIDITERKQTEKALAEARDQALEASRLKSQLLAKVSHELRTPLGAILGYTELLQMGVFGQLSDKQQGATVEIIDSTYYLIHLVNELLDQAQFEIGKASLIIAPFSLADLVSQVMSKMTVLAKAKSLTVTTDVAVELPPTLLGDQKRLQQILINLISNAIKFTRSGQVDVRIYQPDPLHWAIRVCDTGIGIPAEAQTYIFEPFQQVDGSITREQVGTGLGLSIVKQLTSLMGGEITLESEIGRGSTFTILLPLTSPTQEKLDD